jgi:hypothetical protein
MDDNKIDNSAIDKWNPSFTEHVKNATGPIISGWFRPEGFGLVPTKRRRVGGLEPQRLRLALRTAHQSCDSYQGLRDGPHWCCRNDLAEFLDECDRFEMADGAAAAGEHG